MNYRVAELMGTTNFASSGVKDVDLDIKDPISAIQVIAEVENGDYVPDGHPCDVLEKIEVLDGSEVIASLTGGGVQAAHFYGTGDFDHNELNYEDNAICRASATLDFGKYLWDEELALDPAAFRNLKLSIEHDYSKGGSSVSSVNIRVLGFIFDDKRIAPKGFLHTQEIYSYTPAAGAAEYIDLPVDNPIRGLMFMNTNNNEEPDIQFETIKVDGNGGKRIYFDGKCMDLIRLNKARYGEINSYLSGQAIAGERKFYCSGCKDIKLSLMLAANTDTYLYHTWSGGREKDIRAGAAVLFHGLETSLCPHGAVWLPTSNPMDSSDFWNPAVEGSARAILTPRSGTCDTNKVNRVIVQAMKGY